VPLLLIVISKVGMWPQGERKIRLVQSPRK